MEGTLAGNEHPARQPTFRWTLLPENLDFQPDEREGGNIMLPRTRDPLLRLKFDNLYCAEDPQ